MGTNYCTLPLPMAPISTCNVCFLIAAFAFVFAPGCCQLAPGFRPPSVPLLVVDPYFSVWSNEDNLYDDFPKHWTGVTMCFSGMISIDGKVYRFMAKDTDLATDSMQQKSVQVFPTRTVYSFLQGGVSLNLTFSTPSFPANVTLGSLPVSYITYDVVSVDGQTHSVSLYYDNTAEVAVESVTENVVWSRNAVILPGYETMRIGTQAQKYLAQGSDQINWGYFYVSVEKEPQLQTTMAHSTAVRMAFQSGKAFPPDDTNQPRPCNKDWPVLAVGWDLGKVGEAAVSKYLLLAYDQVYSIRYFGTAMAPYWRHTFKNSVSSMLQFAHSKYADVQKECSAMDMHVSTALYQEGGATYTTIASLVWRQVVGGTIVVWNNVTNEEWRFMKEISSDGDVSTVDVIYPASPFFLWQAPQALFLTLKPVMEYAMNNTAKYGLNVPYNLSWAPHHLGHWPICDLPPNKQEQMPIEETGNMLAMLSGIAMKDPQTTLKNLGPYWPLLEIWGRYLVSSLPDPGDQLCTDDFEGKSPHNVNLAAKGIVALAAYAFLLDLDGQHSAASYYSLKSQEFVLYWLSNASDGDHYRLQYNLPNTWSMKYNILYQRVLNISVFPDLVMDSEEDYYQTKMNPYGVPLDCRADFTKSDWSMWIAAMGYGKQFQTLTDALYAFATTTPDRVPFTDFYYTSTAKVAGFRARPVMGGLYARLLLV